MSGDFSKSTFDKKKDYSLVRMQQGRLFSDADFNEQGDILRHSNRQSLADLIGPAGFPDDDPGFALTFDGGTGAMLIGRGTGYVAGVRHVVREAHEITVESAGGSGANKQWRLAAGKSLAEGDVVGPKPDSIEDLVLVRDLSVEDDSLLFRTTPPLPDGSETLFKPHHVAGQPQARGGDLPEGAGDFLAVLHSTELAVTALDDATLREVAFDGPDTATRDKTIWQIQFYSRAALEALYKPERLTCPALAQGFDPLFGDNAPAELRARAELSDLSAGPCTLPPAAGYRSLDNLLYRVEIHTAGSGLEPTFKWSSENAIHRTRLTAIDAGVLIVESTGRDEMTALKTGNWIELKDQARINGHAPGFFARIAEVVGQRIAIDTLLSADNLDPLVSNGQPDTDALPRTGFITRWEGGAPRALADAIGGWTKLSNGVEISLDGTLTAPGDYWLIPARAVSGDIEWPRDPVSGAPLFQPAHGPRRDYAALGWWTTDGSEWKLDEDCRPLFPALTDAISVHHAGGDGQEVMLDALQLNTFLPLPKPIEVAVMRGDTPVENERVRFQIVDGDGRFQNDQTSIVVLTNADGIASATWRLRGQDPTHQVLAQRLNAAGDPTHNQIRFNATLSRADRVSFDPSNTPALAGINNVQDAIEGLAGQERIGCTTYTLHPRMDWVSVLEGLRENEDASICFSAGRYETWKPVRVRRAGHLKITGAGAGAVNILGWRVETALAFERCASVSVSGVRIFTPDGNSAIPTGERKHRRGALDVSLCDEVEVHDCALRCGGGTSPGRTCLSVRGWSTSTAPHKAAHIIAVTDTLFQVGHLQEAAVLTDAHQVRVENNRLEVIYTPGGGLGYDARIKDSTWLASMRQTVVSNPVTDSAADDSGTKEIRFQAWRATFNSQVPQSEWDKLIREEPPDNNDLRSEANFTAYTNRLITEVTENPSRLPSFDKQLERVKASFGSSNQLGRLNDPKVRQTILLLGKPEIGRFDERLGGRRKILIQSGAHIVSFNSPWSQADWNKLIEGRVPRNIGSSKKLLATVNDVATKAMIDPRVRRNLSSVTSWISSLSSGSVTVAKQGIVIGGRKLGNVTVSGNLVRGFEVGISVASSHEDERDLRARNVMISNNQLELSTEHAEAYGGFGMFVGNADSVRISDNDMVLSSRPNFRNFYAQGIRIWGHVGRQILIAGNRIEIAQLGVRLHSLDSPSETDKPLWVFRENVVGGQKGVKDFEVTPVRLHIERDNLLYDRV